MIYKEAERNGRRRRRGSQTVKVVNFLAVCRGQIVKKLTG
jgi:hypothetical protein